MTSCNGLTSRGPFHTLLRLLTVFLFLLFFYLLHQHSCSCPALFPVRIEKRKGKRNKRMKESERNQSCWPGRFALRGTPACHIHHALMLMAVPDLPTCSLSPQPLSSPSLICSKAAWQRDLTQKWVETNDSNDSRCPPANNCYHYCCPCKWFQMALFLPWQSAASLHWASTGRGKFLPQSS